MNQLQIESNPAVKEVFQSFPKEAREKVLYFRKLIIEVAEQLEDVDLLEETLKWGQPSYISKKGSTIRIDWKRKQQDEYAIFFQCTSNLVPTFRTVFKNEFKFEGNREITFHLEDALPEEELKKIFATALRYHKLKHLPLLGL